MWGGRGSATPGEKGQAGEALLQLLDREDDGRVGSELARGVLQLDPTAEDKRRARETLLRLLPRQTNGSWLLS